MIQGIFNLLKNLSSALLATLASATLCGQAQPGTVLWSYDVGSAVVSSPAIGMNGTVYVGTMSALYAITNSGPNASNKWSIAVGLPSDYSSPAVGKDGTIYIVGTTSNSLVAVNPDGSPKWYVSRGGGGGTPAIGLDNTIYFHGADFLYAINPAGQEKWNFPVAGYNSSAVLGNDGVIYIVSEQDSILYAINPDGSQRWAWTFPPTGYVPTALAISPSGIIYASHDRLRAFSPDGTNLWAAAPEGYSVQGPPIIGNDGTIYSSTPGNHILYAFTPSGDPGWHALGSGDRSVSTAPAIDAGGSIYYCVSNSIFGLSAKGDVLWSIFGGVDPLGQPYANTSPIVGPDGTLYAVLGSRVYAVATGTNGPAKSAWPMYQQNAHHTGKIERSSLQHPKKRADANFEFQLYAQIDQTQTVQTSTELVIWTALTNVAVTNVPMDIVDLSASNFPSRFYRTRSQ